MRAARLARAELLKRTGMVPKNKKKEDKVVDLSGGARNLFKAIDNNSSGDIDQDEWLAYLLPKGLDYNTVIDWWFQADQDDSGTITEQEFEVLVKSCPGELSRAFTLATPPPLTHDERLALLIFMWDQCEVCMEGGPTLELPADAEGELCVKHGAQSVVIGHVRKPTEAEEADWASMKAAFQSKQARDGGTPEETRRHKEELAKRQFQARVALIDDPDDQKKDKDHPKPIESKRRFRYAVHPCNEAPAWVGEGTAEAPLHVTATVEDGKKGPLKGLTLRITPTTWTFGPGTRLRLLAPDEKVPRSSTIIGFNEEATKVLCRVDNGAAFEAKKIELEAEISDLKLEKENIEGVRTRLAKAITALHDELGSKSDAIDKASAKAAADLKKLEAEDEEAKVRIEKIKGRLKDADAEYLEADRFANFQVYPPEGSRHAYDVFGDARKRIVAVNATKGQAGILAELSAPFGSGYVEGQRLLIFHKGTLCEGEVLPAPVVEKDEHGMPIFRPTLCKFRPNAKDAEANILRRVAEEVTNLLEEHAKGAIAADVWQSRLKASMEETADLNPFNHCVQRFDSISAYRAAIASYCGHLADQTKKLDDGITGNQLETSKQLMEIEIRMQGGKSLSKDYSSATSILELATPLLLPAESRPSGCFSSQPVLLRAGPGTGKTWSSVQLVHALATKCAEDESSAVDAQSYSFPLVPALVYVQRLQRMIIDNGLVGKKLDHRIILQYFAREFAQVIEKHEVRAEYLQVVAQAMECRALVLVLDGIDEAALSKDAISTLIREELVPMGLRCVCTSRPEGVQEELWIDRFMLLDLKKLSDEQQRDAVQRQLDQFPAAKEFSDHLMAFVSIRKGHDEKYKQIFDTPALRSRIENFEVSDTAGTHSNPRRSAMSNFCCGC